MATNLYKNLVKILRKKVIIVFSLPLALLLLAFPSPALAFWERIVAAVTAIPVLIITALLLFQVLVTGFFVMIISAILEWIISPDFVSLSYTKPCLAIHKYGPDPRVIGDTCNPIIGIGLDITQHLVNLLLVGILVYIALAIALRIGEYDAKKLFTKLIIVALLVNFAPVLVGVIVDAANIIMNYFLSPLRGGFSQIGNQLSVFWDSIVKSLGKVFDIPAQFGLLGLGMTMVALNTITFFVLGIFAGLFIVRYIAIWVLVILAPIAFVFWILPEGSKVHKFWDMWWNNLIQWSFIGIPVAFFLYLGISSFSVLSQSLNAATIQKSAPGIDPQTMGVFTQLFPFFVVIIFLTIGLSLSFSISAEGAKTVITKTKALGRWAGKHAGKGGAGIARGIPALSRAEEKVRRRLETTPGINRIAGLRPGDYDKERKTSIETANKKLGSIPDDYKGNKSLQQIIRITPTNQRQRYERAAAIETLAKRKSLNINTAEAKRLLPEAQRYGADANVIAKARPDFAPHLTDKKTGRFMTVDEATSKMTPGDFRKNIQLEALENPEIIALMVTNVDRLKAMKKGSAEQKRTIKNTLRTRSQQVNGIIRNLHKRNLHLGLMDTAIKSYGDMINDVEWQV